VCFLGLAYFSLPSGGVTEARYWVIIWFYQSTDRNCQAAGVMYWSMRVVDASPYTAHQRLHAPDSTALLQRLSVIGIFLILIYTLHRKMRLTATSAKWSLLLYDTAGAMRLQWLTLFPNCTSAMIWTYNQYHQLYFFKIDWWSLYLERAMDYHQILVSYAFSFKMTMTIASWIITL
jgi:hypothetical protein